MPGLGKGFDSLIPTDLIEEEFDPTSKQDKSVSRPKNLLISDIKPRKDQPRTNFEEQALKELAGSIKTHGVLQPIVVVEGSNGYLIVAGERRWRAAQIAGLERIPALIRKLNDQAQLEMSLIENIQREDLSPLELATAFMKLQQQFNMALADISKQVGKHTSTISNTIRLLKLPNPAKRALSEGKISEQHGRAILAVKDSKKQQELLDLIIRHKWTPAQAEQYVVGLKKGKDSKSASKRALEETADTKVISKHLKTPVKIKYMAKGGRLIIEFKNEKDLDRLKKLLS